MVGKKALVTGASRGIGKAIALKLAEAGCTVVVHYDQSEAEAEAVVQQIRQRDGQAFAVQATLDQATSAVRLGDRAWAVADGLDFLINNAGITLRQHFLDLTETDLATMMAVNLTSVAFLTQTVARRMIETGTSGSIYTITSVNTVRPGLNQTAYGASKGAVDALMLGVALELAPHGIRVNTIRAGATATHQTAAVWQQPERAKVVNEGIPLGRFGQPDEIAAVLVGLLASDSYMTGSAITIDGGLLLRRGYGKPAPYEFTQPERE